MSIGITSRCGKSCPKPLKALPLDAYLIRKIPFRSFELLSDSFEVNIGGTLISSTYLPDF
jgi:hypothetical protein